MSVGLRKFGIELHRQARKQDLEFAKELREANRQLDDVLRGISYRVGTAVSAIDDPLHQLWSRRKRTYLNFYQTALNSHYFRLSRLSESHQRRGFLLGSVMLRSLVRGLYPPKMKYQKMEEGVLQVNEAPGDVEISFRDTPNASFILFLSEQIDAELSPGNAIKTLSPEHIRIVQREVLSTVDRGLSHAWTRDHLVAQLSGGVTSSVIRRRMENNVMRIIRTSYQQAANAETSKFALDNSDLILGLERVADGRPCMACVALDGKRYPVGAKLDDHPNGMCVFVPIMKTPEEMGLLVTDDVQRKLWNAQQRQVPTLGERFEKLSSEQQRAVFSNDALYNWWNANKQSVSLRDLVVARDGMVTPMSLRQAVDKFGWGKAAVPIPKKAIPSGKD